MYILSAVCRFVRWSFMALAALVAVPAVAHANWLTPSATVTGRLVKFTAQFDF